MEGKNNLIEILVIFFITLIGLIGNCLNLRVFSFKNMKKITTFRYFFHLAINDIILLIVWIVFKLITSGILILQKDYSKIIFRILAFSFSFLSQMNVCIFTAANINKARLILNESKKIKSNKTNLHLKVIFSIGIILICINSHYLMFFNFSQTVSENIESKNKTHQFVYEYLTRPERNFSKTKINLILKKTNLLKINQNEVELFEFHFKNYNSDHYFYKAWSLIQLILFDLTPIIINTISTFIIWMVNKKLVDKNRIKFNRQFILLFSCENILFILNVLIKSFIKIYYKFNDYHLETLKKHILIEIVSYSKHYFSFFVYLFTLNIFRRVASSLFTKSKRINNDSIPLKKVNNFSSFILRRRINLHKSSNIKTISQYLSFDDNFIINNVAKTDDFYFRRRSKSLDAI